jgi:hypothetical protein
MAKKAAITKPERVHQDWPPNVTGRGSFPQNVAGQKLIKLLSLLGCCGSAASKNKCCGSGRQKSSMNAGMLRVLRVQEGGIRGRGSVEREKRLWSKAGSSHRPPHHQGESSQIKPNQGKAGGTGACLRGGRKERKNLPGSAEDQTSD